MSRLESRIDVTAEIDACERMWALDENRLDAELLRAGVDPVGLVQRLEAGLGLACTPGGDEHTESMNREGSNSGKRSDQTDTHASIQATALNASDAPIKVSGLVKFFDAARGFGFVVADDQQGDVMVHISRLQAAGVYTLYESARVDALALVTPRGLQAVEILSVNQSEAVHPSQIAPRTREMVPPESDWVRAIVKWYNTNHGYGFVSEGAGSPDCFIHADTLRRWGLGRLVAGQVVEVRWGTARRGRMVAEIRHPGDKPSTLRQCTDPILPNSASR